MDEIKCVLLDIEGTICPISFVKETLFPYFLAHLPDLLSTHFTSPHLQPYLLAFPPSSRADPSTLQAHIEDLVVRDVKASSLKDLQGYVWATGFESGELGTPMFGDVVVKLKEWAAEEGKVVAVYSSGSVQAQKLLFGRVLVPSSEVLRLKRKRGDDGDGGAGAGDGGVQCPTAAGVESSTEGPAKKLKSALQQDSALELQGLDEQRPAPSAIHDDVPDSGKAASEAISTNDMSANGEHTAIEAAVVHEAEDLRPLITDWFDTTNAGPKTSAESYVKIAASLKLPVDEILFLTDNVKEVDAALEAGMQSVLVIRPGNAVVEESDRLRLRMISSFEELGAVLEKGSNCDDADAVLSAPLENSGAVVASADIEPVEPSPRRSQRVKWKEG